MTTDRGRDPGELWTIGHGTSSKPEFLRRLLDHGIELLVDVRALPGSRGNPQFNADEMPQWLDGIDYLHSSELSGRRKRQDVAPEINAGWHNASFKNYADHTLTDSYQQGLERLEELAAARRTVIMCGEPVPWRCHRLLIANSLVAQGWTVWHLIGDQQPRRHELGQWGAKPSVADDLTVRYPPGDHD